MALAGFRVPQAKITWIQDSGLPYMGRSVLAIRKKKQKKKTALWPESRSVRPQIFVRVSYLRHPSWLKDEI